MPEKDGCQKKTDAERQADTEKQADAERQAKKRLGVASAEHRTPTMRRNTAEIEG